MRLRSPLTSGLFGLEKRPHPTGESYMVIKIKFNDHYSFWLVNSAMKSFVIVLEILISFQAFDIIIQQVLNTLFNLY